MTRTRVWLIALAVALAAAVLLAVRTDEAAADPPLPARSGPGPSSPDPERLRAGDAPAAEAAMDNGTPEVERALVVEPARGTGRVVEVDARGKVLAGIEGIELTVRRGAKRIATLVSGPDGHFAFDVDDPGDLLRSMRVRGAAPKDFGPGSVTQRLDDGWPTAGARLEFARTGAPRGQVVVEGTDRPLAHFPLKLSGGGERNEELSTDADGRFEGRESRRAGPVQVELLGDRRGWPPDSPRIERTHEVLPEGVLEWKLEASPALDLTVRIEPPAGEELPSEVGGLRCNLLGIGADWPRADRAFLGSNLIGHPTRIASGDEGTLVYRLWINDLIDLERWPGPWVVRLEPFAGGWVAEGAFEAQDLEGGEPIRAVLRRTGSVSVRLVDGNGEPVVGERVRLSPVGIEAPRQPPGPATVRRPRESGSAGEEVWTGLDPGHYRLEVDGLAFEPLARELEVRAGETTEATLGLSGRRGGGNLVARVETRSGQRRHAMFWLRPRGEGQAVLSSQGADWREVGGRWVGEARFEDLKPGDFKLELISTSGLPATPLVAVATVEALGTTTLDFVFEDAHTAPLAVVARDARSGSALDEWRLLLGDGQWFLASDLREVHDGEGGRVLARYVPTASTAPGAKAWIIADGRRASAIDLSAGRVVDEDGTRLHQVDLAPGWGKLMVIVDSDRVPVEGARVFVDGRLAGRTDAIGRVLMSAAAEPERIEFELDGFEVRSGSIDPVDGRYLGSDEVALFGYTRPQ